MAPMSNNQWTGAQDWNAQPQQSNAQDWNAQSAQDWNAPAQQPAQDWNAPAQQPTQDWGASSQDQTTIQPAAQDWNAPAQEQTSVTAAQDWNAQPQQSVPSAPEWGTPGQENTAQQNMQDWNQQAAWGAAQQAQPQQQQWGGQQQAAPYGGQQQWGGQQQAPSGLGALFDFGFKGSLLKGSLGAVYLVSVIAVGVIVLVTLINGIAAPTGLALGNGAVSAVAPTQLIWALFAPISAGLIALILIRAILEALASVVKKNENNDTHE